MTAVGGFEATLGFGEVVLELAAELLCTLKGCVCLAALELGCLSRCALVGELALERRAFLAGALLDPVGAVGGGLGALLGVGGALVRFVGERVAALGVVGGSGGFSLGGRSARFGLSGLCVGLIAGALAGAGALQRVIAVLFGLSGPLALARCLPLGLSSGRLRGGLRGDRGRTARTPCATGPGARRAPA